MERTRLNLVLKSLVTCEKDAVTCLDLSNYQLALLDTPNVAAMKNIETLILKNNCLKRLDVSFISILYYIVPEKH